MWLSLDPYNTHPCISVLSLCISCVFYTASYRIKGAEADKMNEASQYRKSLDHYLKNIFKTENLIITDWPEFSQGSPAGTEKPEESEVMMLYSVLAVTVY